MWWECSDCGCRFRDVTSPSVCPVCGASLAHDDRRRGDEELLLSDSEGFSTHWLLWGLEDLPPPIAA